MFMSAMRKPPQPKKPKNAKTAQPRPPLTGKQLAEKANKYQGLARVSFTLGNLWS